MLERDMQKTIVKLCREHDILAVKTDSTSTRGWPDLTVILPEGTVLFVELKTETGRLSAMQKHVLGKLKDRKANAEVIRSVAEFRELIRTYGIDP